MLAAGCPRCRGAVALHEGRPVVTSAGAVELWHRGCFERRGEPVATIVAATTTTRAAMPVATLRAPPRARGLAVAAVATIACAGVAVRWTQEPAAQTSLANVELGAREELARDAEVAHQEPAPPVPVHVETPLEARFPIPEEGGEPLDHVFGSLAGWTHPVTSSAELMPALRSRLFGSERAGIERPECGDGHCGVDLDGPRGRPIVAVADGVVVRVERSERGADGRSGRYVRLQHDDGTLTAYMHLDDVAGDLDVGDRVRGGQYVGTLGATAVYSAPPHLHFSLEVPRDPATRGDVTATRYVDPAPFLVRAMIVKTPERRHAVKPAF